MSKPFQPDEEDLAIIRGLQSERYDEAVLQLLTDGFKGPVHAMVLKNNGSKDDAEDLYGDVLYILIWKAKKKGFTLTSKLSTFIYSIAWRQWLKKLKKRKDETGVQQMLRTFQKVEQMEDVDWALYWGIMDECLNGLDKRKDSKCKALILATNLEGESHESAAKKFGYKDADTVKVKKSQCMKRLKACCRKKLKELMHGN